MFNDKQSNNTPGSRQEDRYYEFENLVAIAFTNFTENGSDVPLFKTDAKPEELWAAYIESFPINNGRDHYNCNTCRHFIERFGDLVYIDTEGLIKSVIWDIAPPEYFKKAVNNLRSYVEKRKIVAPFITDTLKLGIRKTGEWTHLNVVLPSNHMCKNKNRRYNEYQVTAQKKENFGMLSRALNNFSLETVNTAISILESNSLYRGEKYLGVAKWFKQVHESTVNMNINIKKNILWYIVAKAPEGFCNINSSMIGTLLDDIQGGAYSFEAIKRRFDEKTNPSNYMRSQSAPTVNAIKEAEKVIADLGLANSLQRRYATIDEVISEAKFGLWTPRKEVKVAKTTEKPMGVFAGITPKNTTVSTPKVDINIPAETITWDKFTRTLLKDVVSMDVKVESANRLMALVTAVNPEAENIMKWNNTFSWYYHGGVDAEMRKRVTQYGGKYDNNIIRCSLMWEGPTDLDLHCMCPDGHLYYGNKRGRNGYLDLDMNGMDKHSNTPVENMRWETCAPSGRYEFYVNNYNERQNGQAGTPYKVELEVNGKVYHFEGENLQYRKNRTVFKFDYHLDGSVTFLNQPVASTVSTTDLSNWNIEAGFNKVNLVTTSPNTWGTDSEIDKHIFFILDNCKDLSDGLGRGFFNEHLKNELKPIRKTLEAFTAQTPIEGIDNASACGIGFNKEKEWNVILRIKTISGATKLVKIDRWD